jgi:hypothetical protein
MIAGVGIQFLILRRRVIDFVPPEGSAGERAQFWVLHSWYLTAELVKCVLGLTLAARVISHRSRRSGDVRKVSDMADEANRHDDVKLRSWYLGVRRGRWGLALAARLVSHRGGRSGNARQQFNMVDKANHRHVDGL